LGLTAPGLDQILGTDLSTLDRDFICHFPVVTRMLRLGRQRVRDFLERRSQGAVDDQTIEALFQLAKEAYTPRDLDDQLVAQEFQMEFERLALIEKQVKRLDKQIAKLYAQCDPTGLARSLPGFGPVVSAIMVAEAGTDLSRFPTAKHFAAWTGLVGQASGTAGKHLDGLPITKAGRSIVKWALFLAATAAAQHDPQMQAIYKTLTAKKKHHNLAITAVAHQLARTYWAIMTEQRPFQKRPARETDATQDTT